MTACSLLDERADDFAWCEDVIRRNSHSFYRAFSLLPACKRQSVYALYAVSYTHLTLPTTPYV